MEDSNTSTEQKNFMHNPIVVIVVIFGTSILFIFSFLSVGEKWIENDHLITAAAIVPLLYTTIAQHIELGYQRKELKESTQALQGQQKELNETKEINDKHQINNQFFQLLSMRETFTHSINSGSRNDKERLFTLSKFYTWTTEFFEEYIIESYLDTLTDSEKLKLYQVFRDNSITYSSESQKIDELYKKMKVLVSYYDDSLNTIVWPGNKKKYDEEVLIHFIKELKRYVDNDEKSNLHHEALKNIIRDVERRKGVLNKHFAYHKSIVTFVNSIKYKDLQWQLKGMYVDILTEAERFYFGLKMLNRPFSTYIFRPTSDVELRNELFKESLFDLKE